MQLVARGGYYTAAAPCALLALALVALAACDFQSFCSHLLVLHSLLLVVILFPYSPRWIVLPQLLLSLLITDLTPGGSCSYRSCYLPFLCLLPLVVTFTTYWWVVLPSPLLSWVSISFTPGGFCSDKSCFNCLS